MPASLPRVSQEVEESGICFLSRARILPSLRTRVGRFAGNATVHQQELARMATATVLLLSSDPSLIESCEGITASVDALRPLVLPLSEDPGSYLGRKDLALIL